MKHFNMTQWRVLCPHNCLPKTTTILPSISASCPVTTRTILRNHVHELHERR